MTEASTEPESPGTWQRLDELVRRSAWSEVRELLRALSETDRVHVTSHLSAEVLADVLEAMRRGDAAELLEELPGAQAASAIEEVEPRAAARILDQLPSDERADLLAQVETEHAEAILAVAHPDFVEATRALLAYPPGCAGGLMATELFAVPEDASVGEVIERIRTDSGFRHFEIQYVYVCSADAELRGVVQLRSLILARPATPVSTLMLREPVSVGPTAELAELEELFDHHSFLGVPVVDEVSGRLLGIVHRSAVEEATSDNAQADTMKALGIASGEELRSMPLWLRSRRRLAWLSLNILLNAIAATVIASYQDTLQAAIALAVFLPMISDMSGCSGNQAVAVSLRELSLGVLRPHEFFHVWRKEVSVGVINGLVLGALIGVVAMLWKGSPALGLVVGAALALNTVVAVSIGGAVPLVIRRLGQDPALASGPVLTTVTDMCGFFFALSFATLALDRIVA